MNPTPNKSTSSNKRKANDAAPSSGSVVGEHESRPPGIKAMKKLRKTKGKEKASSSASPSAASASPSAASASPSAEFSKMFELKQKDLEGMKELQKLSILDSLIAKKENLDEEDKVVKKKLVAELFLT
ncbi:hypothetical protein ARALYDRAFT_344080 [Arabidopsis lyrata subsp. lyrata]|uniref:No apical meristem-associated C-terminal domain-containing protein n=1 Tax=Arabidopsis lyrata subsp. lyrata TaxID=81972 RepID=D7LJF7_ARALL|nr:hypothetical protein ARALYDRAFT_344080 [Arabidopsis lyrata subsp. lyrata]